MWCFLILTAYLLVMLWSQPAWQLPAGFDNSTRVGDALGLALIGTLGYKYWLYCEERQR